MPGSELDTFAAAETACKAFKGLGYSDWRLPTMDETNSAVIVHTHLSPVIQVPFYSLNETTITSRLTFTSGTQYPFWTSTPAGPDKVLVRGWPPKAPNLVATMNPTKAESIFLLGVVTTYCVRKMDPDWLALAVKSHPPSPVKDLTQLQSVWLEVQSEAALAAAQLDKANALAGQALALDPKSPRALEDLGMAQAYAGDFTGAIATLKQAPKDNPLGDDIDIVKGVEKQASKDPNALKARMELHQANVAISQGQWDAAIAAANLAIATEPKWPEGEERLGLALEGEKQWTPAIAALSKAKSLEHWPDITAKDELKDAKAAQKAEAKQAKKAART